MLIASLIACSRCRLHARPRAGSSLHADCLPHCMLEMPPACTAKSGFVIASMWNEAPEMACKCSPRRHAPPLSHRFVIASMWNEAAQHIEGWKTQRPAPPDAGKVGRLADEF